MIDAQIENWCRWHWSAMRQRRKRCMSLERNWRSKQPEDTAAAAPLPRVDQKAAQLVEEAWRTLPFREKMLLKWHFVFARTPGAICRSLRQRGVNLAPAGYPYAVMLAKTMLAEALDASQWNAV